MLEIWVTRDENANPSEKKRLLSAPTAKRGNAAVHSLCLAESTPEGIRKGQFAWKLPPPGRSVG